MRLLVDVIIRVVWAQQINVNSGEGYRAPLTSASLEGTHPVAGRQGLSTPPCRFLLEV